MQGILIINKPKGYTSFDCVAIARRQSGERRCGHTGTLDPDATGVLPICIGKATRLIEYMDGAPKQYRCVCRLGVETSTYDLSGEITGGVRLSGGEGCVWPSEEELNAALQAFTGEIEQYPPLYSAVKVNGKRLYKYALEGKSVEIKTRRVTVYSIVLLDYDRAEGQFTMDVTCSRGTYVRSICHDLGKALGTGAAMAELVRLSTGGFDISEAIDVEELKTMSPEELEQRLYPAERAVQALESIETDERGRDLFMNGNLEFSRHVKPRMRAEFREDDDIAVFCGGVFLGTAKVKADVAGLKLVPGKVFK